MDPATVNNLVWTIHSLIETAGVCIHLYGKSNFEQTQKREIQI